MSSTKLPPDPPKGSKGNWWGDRAIECTFCLEKGHWAPTCPQKRVSSEFSGIPEHVKARPHCGFCGKPGHAENRCWSKAKPKQNGNGNLQAQETRTASQSTNTSAHKSLELQNLAPTEQLKKKKGNNKKNKKKPRQPGPVVTVPNTTTSVEAERSNRHGFIAYGEKAATAKNPETLVAPFKKHVQNDTIVKGNASVSKKLLIHKTAVPAPQSVNTPFTPSKGSGPKTWAEVVTPQKATYNAVSRIQPALPLVTPWRNHIRSALTKGAASKKSSIDSTFSWSSIPSSVSTSPEAYLVDSTPTKLVITRQVPNDSDVVSLQLESLDSLTTKLSPAELLKLAAELRKKEQGSEKSPMSPPPRVKGFPPTEREIEMILAEENPYGTPTCKSDEVFQAAVAKAKIVVEARDNGRMTSRVKMTRFWRNPEYVYKKPRSDLQNVFTQLPYEIFQTILSFMVGDSASLLSLAATCQNLSENVFDCFKFWDVNDGGHLNKDYESGKGSRNTQGPSARMFAQVVGTQNPEYHNSHHYDILATVRLVRACHNFSSQIQHLEFYNAPLLTLKVLETIITPMKRLKFFRIEYCPQFDFGDTRSIMKLCLPEYNYSGQDKNFTPGRTIDFDFRPYLYCATNEFKKYDNYSMFVLLSLRTILPIAFARRFTLARYSSSFGNVLSKCSNVKELSGRYCFKAGITRKLWSQMCKGSLTHNDISDWIKCQHPMRRRSDEPAITCFDEAHDTLSEVSGFNVSDITDTSIFCFPRIAESHLCGHTCLGCTYLEYLAMEKDHPQLSKRRSAIDCLYALGKKVAHWELIDKFCLDEDERRILEYRLGLWEVKTDKYRLTTLQLRKEISEDQIHDNMSAVRMNMCIREYGSSADRYELRSLSPGPGFENVREKIFDRILEDNSSAAKKYDLLFSPGVIDAHGLTADEEAFLLRLPSYKEKCKFYFDISERACKHWEGRKCERPWLTWKEKSESIRVCVETVPNRSNRRTEHWSGENLTDPHDLRMSEDTRPFRTRYPFVRQRRMWRIDSNYEMVPRVRD